MIRRAVAAAGISLGIAACAGVTPATPSTPAPTGAEPSTAASGPIGDPGNPLSLRPPGQPFTASQILEAMRDSRRPGGVPDELETEAIAAAVADALWTLEGEPWTSITAGGTCGEDACILELAGRPSGAAGEDVWVLEVTPDGGVEALSADLHGVPSTLLGGLDAFARAADEGGRLDDLVLTAVRWQPPPNETRFVLAYRSGDEEGSCVLDLELDTADGSVTELSSTGC